MSLRVAAILSMLHEGPAANSAARRFQGQPVLRWTIDRLGRAQRVSKVGILCWDDQRPAVLATVEGCNVEVMSRGPRCSVAELDRVTVARQWSDGWRGGLHSTCWFDAGFHGPWVSDLADKLQADAVMFVPAAAALVDSHLVDALIDRAAGSASLEMTFTAAAPGLAGAVVKRGLLRTLVEHRSHPGRLLHYMPERPMLDPVGSDACIAVPASVSRSRESLLLDSERRISRLTSVARKGNGLLMEATSEELVARLTAEPPGPDAPPRDVTIELSARRLTSPTYMPVRAADDDRAALDLRAAVDLIDRCRGADDVRLTIGGRGDPLCSPILFDVIAAARAAGAGAVHVETDLADADPTRVAQLAAAEVDVVSVFLPALAPATYAATMGVDAMARVMENLKAFVTVRAARGRGTPLIVPTFVKLAANLAEMDAWYDQWIGALGMAVIVGPGAFGQRSLELADMSPARGTQATNRPQRLFLRCDGSTVQCDDDTIAIGTRQAKEAA